MSKKNSNKKYGDPRKNGQKFNQRKDCRVVDDEKIMNDDDFVRSIDSVVIIKSIERDNPEKICSPEYFGVLLEGSDCLDRVMKRYSLSEKRMTDIVNSYRDSHKFIVIDSPNNYQVITLNKTEESCEEKLVG